MRSTKSIILIVIALGCGLIASIGISQVLGRPDTNSSDTESIYVAASSVQSWSKLSPQLVQKEDWPIDKIPQGAARTLEEFEGMSPRYPLYAGEPIIISKLSDGNGKIASERIPEGHQVFAVKVDKESALSGLISPGDRVDVLVFIRGRNGNAEQLRTGTRTIMRNATVFAVNDQIARSQDDEASIDAKTVSLLVLPEQSERLLLAKQLGTIHLALRKPGDESQINTDGAKPGDLDQSSEGSDGQIASNNESNPKDGIFDILKVMKGATSTAVDSSNAPRASGPSSTMVIMSPDGVLGTYSFADDSKQNGLPALPTELLGGVDSNVDSGDMNSGPESTDGVDDDDNVVPSDDVDTDVDILDPADLGL